MTHRTAHRLAALSCAALLALTGCSGADSTDDGGNAAPKAKSTAPKEPSKVEVPLTKKDPDASYVVGKTATVVNETNFADEVLGYLTFPARTATEDPASNMHRLSARVNLKGGESVECAEHRSFIWTDFGKFEDLNLWCDSKLRLSDVTGVVAVP